MKKFYVFLIALILAFGGASYAQISNPGSSGGGGNTTPYTIATYFLTSTAVQAVKGSSGTVFWVNLNSSAQGTTIQQAVNLYNVASGSVTVGTTTPTFTVQSANGAFAFVDFKPNGITFNAAISLAAVGDASANPATSSTAPTNAVVTIAYQ